MAVILCVQIAGAVFFLYDMLSALFGFAPLPWTIHELFEIAAAICLILGSVMGAVLLRAALKRNRQIESQLKVASGAFTALLEEQFEAWSLTPAERDVALFAIKGLGLSEIAALRKTSEGTVKAQMNAVYRKAGVTGRVQLVSLFIEDLMSAPLSEAEAGHPDRIGAKSDVSRPLKS